MLVSIQAEVPSAGMCQIEVCATGWTWGSAGGIATRSALPSGAQAGRA